nr:unnamed protein product [Digitaria exilis]
MTKTTSATLAVLLLAALAVQQQLAVPARAAITCPDVVNDMEPCLSFLQGGATFPSAACCAGVRAVYAAADSTEARRDTCECLKNAYNQINAQLGAAQALPRDCGLNLGYTITPEINCQTLLVARPTNTPPLPHFNTAPRSSLYNTDHRSSAMKKITTTPAFAALLLAVLAVQHQLAAVHARADHHHHVSCSGVINDLSTCLDFLQGEEDRPDDQCCQGVKKIFAAADTTAQRQATCECLKSAYNLVDADLYATQMLARSCGVPLSYTISPDVDCSE